MKAGKLRHRITLQRATDSTDGIGAPTEDPWVDIGSRWARFVPLSGKETFDEGHELATINARFEVRADSLTRELGEEDRVKHNGQVYDIKAAIDVGGLGREIHLMCEKVD